MQGVLEQANVLVNHNMTAPAGSTPTGEMHLGVYPVYRRMVERGRIVPVRNEQGEVLYHKRNGVITEREVTKRETWEEEQEFILMPVGNGQTEIVTNFRASPDEAIRKQREAENSNDALAERLKLLEAGFALLGMKPEDILDAQKKAEDEQQAEIEKRTAAAALGK